MTENFRELRPTFQHTSLHAGSAHTRHPARLRALLSAPPSQAYFLLINQLSPRRRAWPELPSQGARAELSALKRQASTSLERKSEHTAGQGRPCHTAALPAPDRVQRHRPYLVLSGKGKRFQQVTQDCYLTLLITSRPTSSPPSPTDVSPADRNNPSLARPEPLKAGRTHRAGNFAKQPLTSVPSHLQDNCFTATL